MSGYEDEVVTREELILYDRECTVNHYTCQYLARARVWLAEHERLHDMYMKLYKGKSGNVGI